MSDQMLAWLWTGGALLWLALWVPFLGLLRLLGRLASRRAAARVTAARRNSTVRIRAGQPGDL